MVLHPPNPQVDLADARTCSSAARALPAEVDLAPEMSLLLSLVARELGDGARLSDPVREAVLALAARILTRPPSTDPRRGAASCDPDGRPRTGVPFSASIRLGRMG